MKKLSLEEAIITIFMECDLEDSAFHGMDFDASDIVCLFGSTEDTVQIYYLVSDEVLTILQDIAEDKLNSKDFLKELLGILKSKLGDYNISDSEVLKRTVEKLGGVYPISKEYYLKNKDVYGSTFYDGVVAWNSKYLK